MKMSAFWDIVTCSLRAMITLMMEVVSTSDTSANAQTTRRNIPEGSHLHPRRHENLKSHDAKCLTSLSRLVLAVFTAVLPTAKDI
jgi:hypothetical protein